MSEVIATPSYVLPSNPADVEKIKNAIGEMVNSLVRLEAEKEAYNAIRERLAEEFEMPKGLSNRIAKTKYKDDFDKTIAETDEFSAVYEVLK